MCFDRDSLPPIPVISGASVSHDELVLEARDGNRLAAFAATPDEPGRTGVVILPDIRGLYRFYEELALRFAERGHAAIAIDYFGRTAGVVEARRRVRVPAACGADDAGGRPGRHGRGVAWLREAGSRVDLHGRVLLRRAPLVARGGGRSRPRRGDRLLRPAGPRRGRLTRADPAGR